MRRLAKCLQQGGSSSGVTDGFLGGVHVLSSVHTTHVKARYLDASSVASEALAVLRL